jgi:hypothetical protein
VTAIMTPKQAKKLFSQRGTTKETKPKKSKYKNIRVQYNGKWFDSKKEMRRFQQLELLQRAGKIKNLYCQVTYDLLPTTRIGGQTQRKTTYIADFVYWDIEKDCEVIEDAKGARTDVYKIKRKLMWEILGKEVREV